MTPLIALFINLFLTAMWPLVGKYGVGHFSGILFFYLGLAIGFTALLPWLIASGRWKMMLAREIVPALLGMGFFSGLASILLISAMAFTTPANAAIMAQIEIFYSALLCRFFLKERISAAQWWASLLIITGTAFIITNDLNSPHWKGDLIILATPWMFQVSHIISRRLPKDLDPIAITGGRLMYGLLAISPIFTWELSKSPALEWSPQGAAALLMQGIGMTTISCICWYAAIRGMDISKATAILLSYPALTLLFSWVLGMESIALMQILGLTTTLAGTYWMSRLALGSKIRAEALAKT